MEIIWTRTKTIVSLCLLALVLTGLVVKHFWFPAVDDRFFQLDYQRLQRAPADLFVLRPTHFADSSRRGCMSARSRLVGRNATIGQIIATAYQCPASRLVVPADMPTNGFDLLVTVAKNPLEKLQAKLKSKFGCVASWQEHETEVWQIRATRPLPPSTADSGRTEYKNGRLCFTHARIDQLLGMLENQLEKPVENQSGLDGYYDISLPWIWRSSRENEQTVKTALAEQGLSIFKGTNTMQMMVVKRAK